VPPPRVLPPPPEPPPLRELPPKMLPPVPLRGLRLLREPPLLSLPRRKGQNHPPSPPPDEPKGLESSSSSSSSLDRAVSSPIFRSDADSPGSAPDGVCLSLVFLPLLRLPVEVTEDKDDHQGDTVKSLSNFKPPLFGLCGSGVIYSSVDWLPVEPVCTP